MVIDFWNSIELAGFTAQVRRVYKTIQAARPTAVDPVNAMNTVLAEMSAGEDVPTQQALALAAAEEREEAEAGSTTAPTS